MTRHPTTLLQVEQLLREYVTDERPLNLREMMICADVIQSVRVPVRHIVDQIPDRQIGWQIKNDWMSVKTNLGQ